ncbi:DMT family transporter [Paraburkholderia aspalathi]|nr:DMT family transporter [Paraburkholderia aspalathi]
MTIDHFGWLGLAEHPIDLPRLIGTALLIGGVSSSSGKGAA